MRVSPMQAAEKGGRVCLAAPVPDPHGALWLAKVFRVSTTAKWPSRVETNAPPLAVHGHGCRTPSVSAVEVP